MKAMQTLTQRLANPTRFMELSSALLPWFSAGAALFIGYAMYLVFFVAPPDYQQGETVKIMYIHVPAAWLAMMFYSIIAVSSFGLLRFPPSAGGRVGQDGRADRSSASLSQPSSRDRSGASPCGAPTGCGTRA